MTTIEDTTPITVQELKKLDGVGSEILLTMKKKGFQTIEDIATSSVDILSQIGIGQHTAKKLILKARELLQKSPYHLTWNKTIPAAYRQSTNQLPLSTGVNKLDDILGNGFDAGTITEIYGASGTGKTQFCHQLCVMVQLPRELGGVNGNAMFIDTQKTFRKERILSIAQKYEGHLNLDNVLKRIYQVDCVNGEHLTDLLTTARSFVRKTNTKLLVIDSFGSHFIGELYKANEYKKRQQKLNHDLYLMAQLIFRYPKLVVVFTNQVEHSPDTYFGDPRQPIGDGATAQASTNQICLRKLRGNSRTARITHSPVLPESEATFKITTEGLCDDTSSIMSDESNDNINNQRATGWFTKLLKGEEEQPQ